VGVDGTAFGALDVELAQRRDDDAAVGVDVAGCDRVEGVGV
jgi:hypothetical protein